MISDIRNYHIVEKLGQGSFGLAYKVLNKNDNKFYVLKQIFLQNFNNDELKELQKEANILSKLDCENIVRYVDSFSENNSFNIVMEFCEGLDLRKFINKYKTNKNFIEANLIYSFIKDLLEGLKYIHNNNLIHRDLKPDNIFIDKYNKLKIGDFGISIKLNDTRYAKSKVGTLIYMAPEIIKGEKYNNKVDIWALGCIIYELCTLNFCFFDSSILGLCNKIINENHGKIDLNLYKIEIQNLIDIMLNKNYKIRPNIDEVYNLFNSQKNKSLVVAVFGEIGKTTFCDLCKNSYFLRLKDAGISEVPHSNIFERCGIECDFIDTSYSDSCYYSLKPACNFLKSKKQIDYIILLINLEERLGSHTIEYMKVLSNIFTPNTFYTHLYIVFTYRYLENNNLIEEMKNFFIKIISEIMSDSLNIKEKNNLPEIPIYFLDIKRDKEKKFAKKSQETVDIIIEQMKKNLMKYPPISTENLETKMKIPDF